MLSPTSVHLNNRKHLTMNDGSKKMQDPALWYLAWRKITSGLPFEVASISHVPFAYRIKSTGLQGPGMA